MTAAPVQPQFVFIQRPNGSLALEEPLEVGPNVGCLSHCSVSMALDPKVQGPVCSLILPKSRPPPSPNCGPYFQGPGSRH